MKCNIGYILCVLCRVQAIYERLCGSWNFLFFNLNLNFYCLNIIIICSIDSDSLTQAPCIQFTSLFEFVQSMNCELNRHRRTANNTTHTRPSITYQPIMAGNYVFVSE